MPFWKCFWYLILTGILSFFVGRVLPKDRFHGDKVPFKPFGWEKNGKVYESLGVRKWQNRVPDMSKICPHLMPSKSLAGDYRSRLPDMIQETCVAEVIHAGLCVTGLACLFLWPGLGGFLIWLVYVVVFNLPYIVIQRFNRPRLIQLEKHRNRRHGSPAPHPVVPDEVSTVPCIGSV